MLVAASCQLFQLPRRSRAPTRADGTKAPQESYLEIDLDFKNDRVLADQYENYRGGVRLGKILEDLGMPLCMSQELNLSLASATFTGQRYL